jgi:hypothetical protein
VQAKKMHLFDGQQSQKKQKKKRKEAVVEKCFFYTITHTENCWYFELSPYVNI